MARMARTENSPNSCAHPEYAQRSLFVFALRRRNQRFWRSLNQLWRQGGILERDALGGSPLDDWLEEIGVIDDWLIDFVKATIDLWNSDPDGPNAALHPDYGWFGIPYLEGSEVPDFQPVFDRPYPISTTPHDLRERLSGASSSELSAILAESRRDEWAETPEEFDKRMRDQFDTQLTEYKKSIRSPYGYNGTPYILQHADWTALAFGGLPYAEIARWDLAKSPHSTPANTVRMAVDRFATDINLTLPRRRKGVI